MMENVRDRLERLRRRLERVAFLVVWVLVMVLIAFGAAGIASGMNRPPGTDSRRELTYAGDQAIEPVIADARAQLHGIADRLTDVGRQGRLAVAQMAANKTDQVGESLAEGAIVISQIDRAIQALTARLANAPGLGVNSAMRVSAANVVAVRELLDAATVTQDLGKQWAAVTQASVDAAKLTALLARHDKLIVSAINASISRRFRIAITRVDQAAAALEQAGKLRDRLRVRTDVIELNEWLRRNRNYDTALRRLYVISAKSPTRVTQELRDALAGERKARSELPKDNSGLVIIMADIGQGGLNQAVIAIERARDKLLTALAEADTPASAGLPVAP
jgi:hypothetical protein